VLSHGCFHSKLPEIRLFRTKGVPFPKEYPLSSFNHAFPSRQQKVRLFSPLVLFHHSLSFLFLQLIAGCSFLYPPQLGLIITPIFWDVFTSHGDKPSCIEKVACDLCLGNPLYKRLQKLVGNDKIAYRE
jgi:hypothetical protein